MALKEWQKPGWKPPAPNIDYFIPAEWGPERVIKFMDPSTRKIFWESNPGPQSFTMFCQADLMLLGGARGGGKTAALIAWLAMGDPQLPEDCPARLSYLSDPNYRALVVRESAQDLKDFVDEAEKFFEPFGGKKVDDPAVFVFPPYGTNCPKIFTNHLGNKDSFSKYKGWNLIRIGVEELTLIEDKNLFLKLLGANRSKWPWLRPQVLCTTNPDGPGSPWVKDFFVEVKGNKGGEVVTIPWGTPMRDPITKLTRIFIPAKLDDNPYLCHDDHYRGMLLSQDEDTRAAWLEGRWDGSSGVFFKEFRPHGPHPGEDKLYPWARHVVPPVELPYWYHRWVGGDWGLKHPSAFYKFCFNEQDGRIHTYDEFITRDVGSFQLGVELAKWLKPELETLPDHRIIIHLSPDAFSEKDADHVIAEQIEAGIRSYLGPYSSFLMEYSADEKRKAKTDPAGAAKDFAMRQQLLSGQMCVMIKRANNDRLAGAAYIRDLLRFIPAVPEVEPDLIHAQNLYQTKGMVAYVDYMDRFKNIKAEILPKIVIHEGKAPILVKCIGSLIWDDKTTDGKRRQDVKKVDGDDPYDGWRYGCMAHSDNAMTVQPRESYVQERLQAVAAKHNGPDTDINMLIMASQKAEAQWDQNQITIPGFSAPRFGSSRHRRIN
jgi:hypothetical protein